MAALVLWLFLGVAVASLVASPDSRRRVARVLLIAETRITTVSGTAAVFAAALVAFAVESVAWPLTGGRNGYLDLLVFLDMWRSEPLLPNLDLYVKPIPALLAGVPMSVGGSYLAEGVLGLLYALTITAFVRAALLFGRTAAVAVGVALLLYLPLGALFHTLGDDAVFACGLAVWLPFLIRSTRSPTVLRLAMNGVAVFALVMIRPTALLLVACALLPVVRRRLEPARRLALAVAALAPLALLLLAFASYQRVHYGDFVVSRTGSANFPLYRLFTHDRLVSPDNGTASAALAAAVRGDLLRREPYRSYGIDVHRFFAEGSPREWADLVALSDRTWGWESNYGTLQRVAFEAIRRHPLRYARAVVGDAANGLRVGYQVSAPADTADVTPAERGETVVVDGRRLPRPTEGQPIPAANLEWIFSRPGGDTHTVWPTPAEPQLRFRARDDQLSWERLRRRADAWDDQLPNRSGSSRAAAALNALSGAYPPMAFWFALGAGAALLRRPRGFSGAGATALVALALFFVTTMAQPLTPQYRLPFDGIFVFAALAAALAPRGDAQGRASTTKL